MIESTQGAYKPLKSHRFSANGPVSCESLTTFTLGDHVQGLPSAVHCSGRLTASVILEKFIKQLIIFNFCIISLDPISLKEYLNVLLPKIRTQAAHC